MSKRVVFLYTELAAYFMACLKELSKYGVEIHIVRWPVNAEAPFVFGEYKNVYLYERNSFGDDSLIHWLKEINPQVVLVSGWIDKAYLNACDHLPNDIARVLLMDNPWRGTLKQKLALLLDPHKIKRRFSHVWVPGEPQYQYALKMGFDPGKAFKGFYSADTTLFNRLFEDHAQTSSNTILYVGRYVKFKGIFTLWSAFQKIADEFPEWELICVGTGEEWENRTIHPRIKHLGFVQPTEMAPYILNAKFFVMPSEKEPWGVVMHEMAAAGLPLIATNEVGAASAFLEEGKNGYLIPSGNEEALVNALKRALSLTSAEYTLMREHSHLLASKISPSIWSATLLKLVEESVHSNHD